MANVFEDSSKLKELIKMRGFFLNLKIFFLVFLFFACDNFNKSPLVSENRPNPQPTKQEINGVKNIATPPLLGWTHDFDADEQKDLHGVFLKDAKETISQFLKNSQSKNQKHVLLVTGKGLHSSKLYQLSDGAKVGPIKYNFLKWYQEGEFNEFIENISYAQLKHGGEGAFYIELKSK